MADENQGPGLFDVPQDPFYIRTPRVKLVGTAIAFLFLIIAVFLNLTKKGGTYDDNRRSSERRKN